MVPELKVGILRLLIFGELIVLRIFALFQTGKLLTIYIRRKFS